MTELNDLKLELLSLEIEKKEQARVKRQEAQKQKKLEDEKRTDELKIASISKVEELFKTTFFVQKSTGELYIDDDLGTRPLSNLSASNIYKTFNFVPKSPELPIDKLTTYEIKYRPNSPHGIIENGKYFNKYIKSSIVKEAEEYILLNKFHNTFNIETVKSKMPFTLFVINRILLKAQERSYLLQWLSATLQGKKLNIGIVLLDNGGTGKSLILEYAMHEILGDINYRKIGRQELLDPFKAWVEDKQLIFGEEISSNSDEKEARDAVSSFLKNVTTGQTVSVRRMRVDSYAVENTFNMILASNKSTPIYIDDTDRRWSVLGGDTPPLKSYTEWNIQSTEEAKNLILNEARWFAIYLLALDVDYQLLSNNLDTSLHNMVIERQRTAFVELAKRASAKDFTWFKDTLESALGKANRTRKLDYQDKFDIAHFVELIKFGRAIPNTVLFEVFCIIFHNKNVNIRDFIMRIRDTQLLQEVRPGNILHWKCR